MANFSATEIKRQAERLEQESNNLRLAFMTGEAYCESIASMVKSEDSNLAGAWTKLAGVYSSLASKYSKALDTMNNRMKMYSAKTIVLEEGIESAANKLGDVLENVSDWLQNIDL